MNNGSHGIGLSVCKRFAKQLNGDLSLTESYTDGCEFVFKLVVKVVRDYRQVDSQIQRVKIKKKRTDRATIPGPNVDMFKIFLQLFFGFFGLVAMTYPYLFYEDTAIVPVVMTFWKGALDSPGEVWWARAFGCVVVTISLGPNLGVSTEGFLKQAIISNLLNIVNFTSMVFTSDGVVVEWMFLSYVPVFVALAVASAYFLKEDGKLQPFMI